MIIDPIAHFKVYTIVPIHILGMNLSVTNVSFFIILITFSLALFFFICSFSVSVIPSFKQSVIEVLYFFIHKMCLSISGSTSLYLISFVMCLFSLICMCNLIGIAPIFPSINSQFIIPFGLSILVISIVVLVGLCMHSYKFFKIFIPSGIPSSLLLVVTPIEIISFVSRPFSLALRLWINILAGHILLYLFSSFTSLLLKNDVFIISILFIFPFLMVLALVLLEVLVAFIQAYVFSILTCIYFKDSTKGH